MEPEKIPGPSEAAQLAALRRLYLHLRHGGTARVADEALVGEAVTVEAVERRVKELEASATRSARDRS